MALGSVVLLAGYAILPGTSSFCRTMAVFIRAVPQAVNSTPDKIRRATLGPPYEVVSRAARNTPTNARILLPDGPKHIPLSNAYWCAYYLYPRQLLRVADLDPGIPIPAQVDYVVIDKGWGLALTGVPPDSVRGTEMGLVQVGQTPIPPAESGDFRVPEERRVLRSGIIPLLLLLPGWILARRLTPGVSLTMRAGLASLLGVGAGSTLLFMASLLGAPLRPGIVLGILGVASVGLIGLDLRTRRPTPSPRPRWSATALTPAETFLALALAGLMVLSALKAGLYPVFAMDAHSYDGRARWIAAEGRLDPSIYSRMPVGTQSNLTYPPLLPISTAFAYWTGGGQGKVIDTFYFAGILLVLVGFLRGFLPLIGALFGGLLFVAAPNIWNHAWWGLTNLPAMAFLASAIFLALSEQWLAAGLLFAFAAGVRGDAALLAGLAGVVLVWTYQPKPGWRNRIVRAILVIGPPFLMTILWRAYLKFHLGIESNEPLRRSLVPDIDATIGALKGFVFLLGPPLYGWVGYFFLISLAASSLRLFRRHQGRASGPSARFSIQMAVLAAMAAGLVWLFQQLDPSFGGGHTEILNTSYKRQLMYLVPIIISAALAAPGTRRFWVAADRWQIR